MSAVAVAELVGVSSSHLQNMLLGHSKLTIEATERVIDLFPELGPLRPPAGDLALSKKLRPRTPPSSAPASPRQAAEEPSPATSPTTPDRALALVRFGMEVARLDPTIRATALRFVESALSLELSPSELRMLLAQLGEAPLGA
jgi:hypothetical protein